MKDYDLENGYSIEVQDCDNELCLDLEDCHSIYFTKKDVEHMLTMFRKENEEIDND